jgi:hypothetical protein
MDGDSSSPIVPTFSERKNPVCLPPDILDAMLAKRENITNPNPAKMAIKIRHPKPHPFRFAPDP